MQKESLEKRVAILTSRSWHIYLAHGNLGNYLGEHGQEPWDSSPSQPLLKKP